MGYLLQNWIKKCNVKNNNGNLKNFEKINKNKLTTGHSRGTSLSSIVDSYIYIRKSSYNHGEVIVSFQRIDIIQIIKINFFYNSYPILTIDSSKAKGRFRIQFLSDDKTWST